MSSDPAPSSSALKKGKAKKSTAGSASNDASAAAAAVPSVAAAPSADAIMSLLGSRIDQIESITPHVSGDDATPTADETAAMDARMAALRVASEADPEAVWKQLRAEAIAAVVLARQLASSQERLLRATNQKKSLEALCKEMQVRNKKLGDDLRIVTVEQARNASQTQEKFKSSLNDIQTQLDKHSEERQAQAAENEKLRENLNQLIKFDGVREEHFKHQLHTKELEAKLLDAKLAQQTEFTNTEQKKSAIQAEKIEYLTSLEASLRKQLSEYAAKFETVQETLSKSNGLFASFKDEMTKTAAQMKQLQSDKQAHAKANSESQLKLIATFEEKQSLEAELEKQRRQNTVLANLAKGLQAKLAAGAQSTNDEPSSGDVELEA